MTPNPISLPPASPVVLPSEVAALLRRWHAVGQAMETAGIAPPTGLMSATEAMIRNTTSLKR